RRHAHLTYHLSPFRDPVPPGLHRSSPTPRSSDLTVISSDEDFQTAVGISRHRRITRHRDTPLSGPVGPARRPIRPLLPLVPKRAVSPPHEDLEAAVPVLADGHVAEQAAAFRDPCRPGLGRVAS